MRKERGCKKGIIRCEGVIRLGEPSQLIEGKALGKNLGFAP